MQSNKELDLAFNYVQYTGQNIFLTGKAGTGKTTFLKSLKEKSPKRMIVVAPTGVAAINAGGVTIHSFFQLSFGPQIGLENASQAQNRFSKEKINIIRSLDLLIIDEISMVRADMLDAIDRVLRRFRNRSKPFGGVQMLMIGDLQQLSPVVKSNEWNLLKNEYETVYFFSSNALQKTPYVSIELKHVFRQQDDRFISILNKVRDNKLDQNALDSLNQRHIPNFNPNEEEGFITLCTHNNQAHRINDSKLNKLPSKAHTFQAIIEGKFPEYSYPTDFDLKLKVNAQVMFVKNDPDPQKLFYNGKIGKITKIEDEIIYVLCPGEEDEIAVTSLQWDNVKYSIDTKTAEIREEVEGSFRQFPLKLAWAITIHKSQGLTFERAIIDAEASFAHGQVYVALSRCKTLEGMVLSTPLSNRSIINDGTVSGFIQQVEQNQPGEEHLIEAKLNYQKELLTDLFRFDRISMLLSSMNKQMRENAASFPQVLVDHFKQMQTAFQAEMMEVSSKFQFQIEQLVSTQSDVEKNIELQERISKAANYFHDKVKSVLIENLEKADLEIDNAALRKQINATANNLSDEINLKLACFAACKNGFQVKKLLDTRAKAVIDTKASPSKKRKAAEILSPDAIPHPELYALLRSWRYEKAMELGIPAYMIFSQKALIEMVNYLPVESATLKLINGLGNKKIESFGADILQMIQHYCNENSIEIERIPLKEVSNKKKKPKVDSKKVSFEMFRSGKSLDEIANERGFAETTIEGHLAHYVGLGELAISMFVPEGELKKITAYFKSTDNRSLGEAKSVLGDEISYSELRFVLKHLEFLENKAL
ncbi:MAG: helix-turn-helix domain-containing protein [Bacteroidales bacterium]|nr:helix-turn-helix domain-containing protein [Bacteroidales bacterium]